MKKIKHSKFKNTGFLFELLTRQITYEVLNGEPEKSKNIVKEFFSKGTELAKELRLFNLLINEKYNSDSKADKFVDAILEAHLKIDHSKLNREKYQLVRSIKENFDIDSLMASPVNNYKLLASIHKLFEAKRNDLLDVKDVFDSRITLVEHISNNNSTSPGSKSDNKFVSEYESQDSDLRLLTYKILVESFNKKYSILDESQKGLLKEYINNVSNTSKFKDYYQTKLKEVVTDLYELYSNINDKITKIKLKETINVIKSTKIGRKVTDGQVTSLMMAYELIKELRNVEERIAK